jgi:hypothetical protein
VSSLLPSSLQWIPDILASALPPFPIPWIVVASFFLSFFLALRKSQ